ncbi:hypothetical protein BDW42DRAFT_171993 [Aspergillus taichungensis]|uniref:Uncharacterized protein n=1 Tax=Aspergillus taichungensis TaxID=482145 RepID=A0A2J5HRD4_9EURO|nr:hypothetical protein BDW42DRAFT_171993 [Aspergillus taichungensis]
MHPSAVLLVLSSIGAHAVPMLWGPGNDTALERRGNATVYRRQDSPSYTVVNVAGDDGTPKPQTITVSQSPSPSPSSPSWGIQARSTPSPTPQAADEGRESNVNGGAIRRMIFGRSTNETETRALLARSSNHTSSQLSARNNSTEIRDLHARSNNTETRSFSARSRNDTDTRSLFARSNDTASDISARSANDGARVNFARAALNATDLQARQFLKRSNETSHQERSLNGTTLQRRNETGSII